MTRDIDTATWYWHWLDTWHNFELTYL